MKREDVKNKIPGITEEQLNWLMQENGSDITREKFLSTLSLRRATYSCRNARPGIRISIHALLAESDYSIASTWQRAPGFLSTLSLRRATWDVIAVITDAQSISIHALLAESDSTLPKATRALMHFYPRSPCGERQRKDETRQNDQ